MAWGLQPFSNSVQRYKHTTHPVVKTKSMDGRLDCEIRGKIEALRAQFFGSLSSTTTTSLQSFASSWTQMLENTIVSVCDQLGEETLSLIYSFASLVETVSEGFLEGEKDMVTLLSSAMAHLSLVGVPSVSKGDMVTTSYPRYIGPSYKWLLDNLHNPYPRREVREAISRETGCPQKDIDCWFIDVRKRIGWNDLRKTQFSNKRRRIIEAATQFFVQGDPLNPLTPDLELQFATVQSNANDLYSGKFLESSLAVQLDMTVKGVTEDKLKTRNRQRTGEGKAKFSRKAQIYPSPEPSPRPMPPSSDSEVEECVPISIPTGKRRCTNDDNSTLHRSSKRARFESPLDRQPSYSLPSPPTSVEDISSYQLLNSPLETPSFSYSGESTIFVDSDALQLATVRKRKRRLSDTDSQHPKRLRATSSPPLFQTETDPGPIPDLLLKDTPFGALLGLNMPSVEVDDLDLRETYDIDFFDYSAYNSGYCSSELPVLEGSNSVTDDGSGTNAWLLDDHCLPRVSASFNVTSSNSDSTPAIRDISSDLLVTMHNDVPSLFVSPFLEDVTPLATFDMSLTSVDARQSHLDAAETGVTHTLKVAALAEV
ncbi:C-terminal domain of homeodomain 1-domain-containing protein [Cyathus striatus]|nr:C-terminal domain of homeodomain 1-domain-containing protein [Cyathus striatus]